MSCTEVNEVTKSTGTVSIVVPVYNVASYIERCVMSVMHQTYPASECIIVDDASTDDSINRCKRLIEDYTGPTQFIIIQHNINRGLSATRNTGTDIATSTYIYYIDSDDEMSSDCLEKLVAHAIQDVSIEMVMGNNMGVIPLYPICQNNLHKNEYGQRIPNYMHETVLELRSNEEVREWFFHGDTTRPTAVWNKLLKLSFVKSNKLYNKEGLLWEDILWTYYLMRCLNHVVFINDVTYIYYRRTDSICLSTKYEERLRYFGVIYREISDNVVPGKRIEETEWILKNFCRYLIDAYDNSDYQHAYRIFRRELSDGHHRKDLCLLTTTHILSKSFIGRFLFNTLLHVRRLIRRLYFCLKSR